MTQTNLNIARTLLVIGLVIGLLSWWQTIAHVGDSAYLLVSGEKGIEHAWYHAFREAVGDLASVVMLLGLFFGNKNWRTPQTWWLGLVIMIGYYAPFWVGMPFIPELAAPDMRAEMAHILMTVPSVIALFLARKHFVDPR